MTFKNDNPYVEITGTNKTSEKISIHTGTLGYSGSFVNNYMVSSGYLSLDLEPQETKTDELYFNGNELHLLGIDKIGEFGLGLDVGYNEFGTGGAKTNFDDIKQDIVSVRTSAYDSVDMNTDTYKESINNPAVLSLTGASLLAFNGNGGFDQSGISINSIGLIKNKDDDVTFFLEVQNDTEKIVHSVIGDVSINGVMVYEGLWTGDNIAPGKTAIVDIALSNILDMKDDIADQVDINNVSTIGLEFGATDTQSNTIISPVELEFSL